MGMSYKVVGGPSTSYGVFQFLSVTRTPPGRAELGTLKQIEAIGARENGVLVSKLPNKLRQRHHFQPQANDRVSTPSH
jgi:hypothetical protein